jgi:predicted lysophospholipase L1 biosynthesis ABC-type transport system permease subunit
VSQASRDRFHWVDLEVVGVAADVRSANLSRIDPAFVYMPTDSAKLGDYWLALRIEGEPQSAFTAIARAVTTLDGQPRPGFRLQNLEDGAVKAEALMSRTFMMSAGMLAAMALVLASIGVYGVMAFLVSQREKEIGIRMALGARTSDVLRLMIEQGMRPVILGGIAGLLGALAVSGLLRALLLLPGSVDIFYGGQWFDPMTFGGLALLLATIALAACYIPARRATYVDPMVALRHE